MAGKYVLVTGGTDGIGKATAAGLVALGTRVGITGRDQGLATAAAADIRAATGSEPVMLGRQLPSACGDCVGVVARAARTLRVSPLFI